VEATTLRAPVLLFVKKGRLLKIDAQRRNVQRKERLLG
jgi:hypothetical protein